VIYHYEILYILLEKEREKKAKEINTCITAREREREREREPVAGQPDGWVLPKYPSGRPVRLRDFGTFIPSGQPTRLADPAGRPDSYPDSVNAP
jgi:hypothetical protein